MKRGIVLFAAALCCVSVFAGEAAAPPVMLFPIVKDGKWGYMDQGGKVVIEPQYACAWDFTEGLARVQVGLYRGYIDGTGKMVIEPQFGWAGRFSCGRAAVHVGATPWGNNLMFYQKHNAWKYIDRTGKQVIRTSLYTRLPDFHENVAGSLDTSGKQIRCEAGQIAGRFSEGLAAIRDKAGLYGYVDHSMKTVIKPVFEEAGIFREGLAPVAVLAEGQKPPEKRDWKWMRSRKLTWGFADKTGKTVIEPVFEDAWPFSDGLASVRVGGPSTGPGQGKWGYLDKTGKTVIEPQYDYAWPFSEGLARILKDGKQGYVDTKGTVVIEPKFDIAWEFSKGLARVEIDGKEGYINHKGEYVWEPTR